MQKNFSVKAGAGDKVYRAEGLSIKEDKVKAVRHFECIEDGKLREENTFYLESTGDKPYSENEIFLSPDEIVTAMQKEVTALKVTKPAEEKK